MHKRAPSWGSFIGAVVVAFVIASGCQGGGCGGCPGQGGTYVFPPGRVEQRVVKTRLTKAGIDFLKPRIKDLLKTLIGVDSLGRVSLPVPAAALGSFGTSGFGNASIALEDDPNVAGTAAGRISVDFSSLDMVLIPGAAGTPATPPRIRFSVRDALVDLDLRLLASWEVLFLPGDAACYVRGAVARGTPQQRALLLDLDIEASLEVDAQGNFSTNVTIPTLTTRDLQVNIDAAPSTDPRCADGTITSECSTFCGATDVIASVLTSVRSFLGGFLDTGIRTLLPPIVAGLINGRPLKFQGQLSLASFLGGLLPSIASASPFGYLVAPGQDGFVVDGTGESQGLNLALNGGLDASPTHPCVTPLDPLPLFTPGPFPALSGLDSQQRIYHVGLSIADAFLNEGGVAAYTSGALCLNVGSPELFRATGGRFNINAGALALLVPGLREIASNDAPVMISVLPTSPPKFKFGTGTGTGDTRDSLISLELKGMHLSFFTLIDDRMSRLFEFNADVYVGLTIVILPNNKLQVAIDKVKIDKLTETYNELFRSSDLQNALRLIVNLATSALLGQGISFDVDINSSLPAQLMGRIGIMVNEIIRDGASNDYLSLSLTFTDPSMRSQRLQAHTEASLAPDEPAMATDTHGQRLATGRVGIDVGGRGRSGDASDLEFQLQLDGAPWSGFQRGPRLYVDDPRLFVIGDHELLVRSRVVGAPRTLDPQPKRLTFVVDPLAPRLHLVKGVDQIRLDADDERTPRPRLAFSWRVDEGAWTPFVRADRIPLDALPAGERLQVRAQDEAGNVSNPVETRLQYTHGRTTGSAGTTPGCGGAGCTLGSGGASGGNASVLLLWLAAAALVLTRRGRAIRSTKAARMGLSLVLLALLVTAPLLGGCGDSGPGNTCTADEMCPAGFRCIDKQCAPPTRCDDPISPSLCCPGQICSSAGTCIDVIDRCNMDGTCEKPGKLCSLAGQDGGLVDGGASGTDGICTYKSCSVDSDCREGSCFNGFCRTPTPCEGGCNTGFVCITPTDECYPAPTGCQTQTCGVGQILVLNNVTAQIGGMCNLKTATCACADIPQIAPGDWGRDSRIAVLTGGLPVVSAYDKTYGDLVLARYNASGVLQKLEYVDGVPTGERPTGRPSGIRGGVTAPGPNVGRYTSVAVSQGGSPLISYYDIDNADLKFAAFDGTAWKNHVVDSAGDVGRYTHLVVAPDGKPHIAYFQKSGVAPGERRTALKLARAKTVTPTTAADWDILIVDALELPVPPAAPCGGTCTSTQVCISHSVDGGVATQRCVTAEPTPTTCLPACPSTQACVASRCETLVPAPPAALDDLPEGVGLFPSLAFSSTSVPHVAYYDRTNGNLKGARASSATPTTEGDWQKAIVDGATGSFVDGDVGLWPSLAFLPDGKLVIAYEDATNDDLVFYTGAGFTGGTREIADPGNAGRPLSLVGADAALAVAPNGQVFVAYQDATFNDLKLARRTAASTWTTEAVLSEGAWGFFADLVISGGKLYISSLKFGFDENAQPQNELRVVIRNLP